jgi:hypothetical protein
MPASSPYPASRTTSGTHTQRPGSRPSKRSSSDPQDPAAGPTAGPWVAQQNTPTHSEPSREARTYLLTTVFDALIRKRYPDEILGLLGPVGKRSREYVRGAAEVPTYRLDVAIPASAVEAHRWAVVRNPDGLVAQLAGPLFDTAE